MIPLPRWLWLVLAGLGTIVLVLGATALVVSLPVLARVAGSQRSLDRVNDIDRQVVSINSALQQLHALDGLSHNVKGIPGGLSAVNGSLGGVDASLAQTIRQLDGLRVELRPLEAQAPSLSGISRQLQRVEVQLAGLAGLGALPASLNKIERNTHGIDTLPAELAQLVQVLKQVEHHVANLDEKTGPNAFTSR
jgi:hypothetical protein